MRAKEVVICPICKRKFSHNRYYAGHALVHVRNGEMVAKVVGRQNGKIKYNFSVLNDIVTNVI